MVRLPNNGTVKWAGILVGVIGALVAATWTIGTALSAKESTEHHNQDMQQVVTKDEWRTFREMDRRIQQNMIDRLRDLKDEIDRQHRD